MKTDKEKKIAVIISGGRIDSELVLTFLKEHQITFLIAADRGIEFLQTAGLVPTHIVGDFDSTGPEALAHFRENKNIEIRTFQPEKDFTDTRIAVELAIELGSGEIWIYGGTGTRLDHVLANVRVLTIPARRKIPCYLVDPHNRIRVLTETIKLSKTEQFGKYVSLFAVGQTVEGLTLEGFKFPLNHYKMTANDSIGVSNEIIGEIAQISFKSGMILMAESID